MKNENSLFGTFVILIRNILEDLQIKLQKGLVMKHLYMLMENVVLNRLKRNWGVMRKYIY